MAYQDPLTGPEAALEIAGLKRFMTFTQVCEEIRAREKLINRRKRKGEILIDDADSNALTSLQRKYKHAEYLAASLADQISDAHESNEETILRTSDREAWVDGWLDPNSITATRESLARHLWRNGQKAYAAVLLPEVEELETREETPEERRERMWKEYKVELRKAKSATAAAVKVGLMQKRPIARQTVQKILKPYLKPTK